MSSHPAKQASSTAGYNEIPKYRSPYGPKYKTQPRLFSTKFSTLFTVEKAIRWGGSLAVWGGAAGIALLLVGNKIPVVKNDILKKIPIVRGYFIEQDNIPDCDKPF